MAGTCSECRSCGGSLDGKHVRQLALYYNDLTPVRVAVQYLCPRCGTASWRHYDPADWDGPALALEPDVNDVRGGQSDPAPQRVGGWARAAAEGRATIESATGHRPITVDEVIDFGCWLNQLESADFVTLRGDTAPGQRERRL